MGAYHESLLREIRIFCSEYSGKKRLQSIFIGGGTPSTYPDQLLLDTFGTLKEVLCIDQKTEVTIEVNPGTVRPEQLAVWASCGINRISVGVQSLNDTVLHSLNRLQSAADVYRLLRELPVYFENISVDLILGLPGVGDDEWRDLLATAVAWPITHVSLYFLTVHENTPLYFGVQKKRVTLPSDERMVGLYEWSIAFLAEHGFVQYEVSNFARLGFESVHNAAYWQRTPYKGFGLGACSFDGVRRMQNTKNLSRYIEGKYEDFCEELSAEQAWLELLMLGIRQIKGISLDAITAGLSCEKQKYVHEQVQLLVHEGLVVLDNDRVCLTPRGLSLENEIVLRLSR